MVSIDMSPVFKGIVERPSETRVTYDKFHVIWRASTAVDTMRCIEQSSNNYLKSLHWMLLNYRSPLAQSAGANLDALVARTMILRTPRACVYGEQLREILDRKQIDVVRSRLTRWYTCVMLSKVEPRVEVFALARCQLDDIVPWKFLEALNGLFQAANRRARGFARFFTIRTVIPLIADKLVFQRINTHAA